MKAHGLLVGLRFVSTFLPRPAGPRILPRPAGPRILPRPAGPRILPRPAGPRILPRPAGPRPAGPRSGCQRCYPSLGSLMGQPGWLSKALALAALLVAGCHWLLPF